MGTSGLVTMIATFVVGGALGITTLVGVVSSQTSTPDQSPANVEQLSVDYGQ